MHTNPFRIMTFKGRFKQVRPGCSHNPLSGMVTMGNSEVNELLTQSRKCQKQRNKCFAGGPLWLSCMLDQHLPKCCRGGWFLWEHLQLLQKPHSQIWAGHSCAILRDRALCRLAQHREMTPLLFITVNN